MTATQAFLPKESGFVFSEKNSFGGDQHSLLLFFPVEPEAEKSKEEKKIKNNLSILTKVMEIIQKSSEFIPAQFVSCYLQKRWNFLAR